MYLKPFDGDNIVVWEIQNFQVMEFTHLEHSD